MGKLWDAIKNWGSVERTPDFDAFRGSIKKRTGLIFLKNTLGVVIMFVVYVVVFLAVILLILGVVVFSVRIFSTGTADVFTTKIGVALDSIPAGQAVKGAFSSIFGIVWNPDQVFDPGMKTTVDKNSNRKLGVSFIKFSADPGRFLESENFRTYGMLEMTPFEDTALNVNFACDVDGTKCEDASPPKSMVSGLDTKSLTVSCKCNAGETKKEVDGKVVTFKATYDFLTRGYMPLYSMGSKRLDAVRTAGGNPFGSITNPNLDKNNGVVTSTYTNGPLKLAIGSYYTQPFTEDGPSGSDSYYIMNVELTRKLSANGIPAGMKSFSLFVPQFVELDTSDGLFVAKGNNEDNFKIYEMNKESLKQVNGQCKQMGIVSPPPNTFVLMLDDLTNPDCRKIWEKGFLPIHANIRFTGMNNDEDIKQSYIIVEARYLYEDSVARDIIVNKKPTGGVTVVTNSSKN